MIELCSVMILTFPFLHYRDVEYKLRALAIHREIGITILFLKSCFKILHAQYCRDARLERPDTKIDDIQYIRHRTLEPSVPTTHLCISQSPITDQKSVHAPKNALSKNMDENG